MGFLLKKMIKKEFRQAVPVRVYQALNRSTAQPLAFFSF
jgi:hypothetical protein